jgi:geranylgeranyl pyrophosphate synthase
LTELSFLAPVAEDLERVEKVLRTHPPEQHEAINLAVDHLINGGGKRLRPTLVLLSARLCGAPMDEAVLAAASAEMLHTATLVHDDLIDGSLIRRGVETLNASWAPAATILTGDYVFARAAYLISRTNNSRMTQRFAETLMVICNGEIRQLLNGTLRRHDLDEYERRIYAKTASLIALSAEAGPILADAPSAQVEALRTYGEHVGTAFQIVDDVLDFVADEETLGKPVGSDLRQGLTTLPVLLYLEGKPGPSPVREVLDGNRSNALVEEAVQAVIASPAIDGALETAREHAGEARDLLAGLADSPYRSALLDLADFTVDRRF